jgi:hypothetical protein
MVVPHRRHRFYRLIARQVHLRSPRSTRTPGVCMHDPSRAQHSQQPLPIPRATVFASLPAATVSSTPLSSARSQLLACTGSTTRSIARARNKCNARFPSPAPPSSPLRAPRPSSAPTPPSAPNLCLPRIANATCTAPGVSLCGRPPSPHILPAFHVHPQRHSAPLVADSAAPRPMRSTPRGGCVCPDDTAAGEQRTNDTEAIRTPRFHCTRLPR